LGEEWGRIHKERGRERRERVGGREGERENILVWFKIIKFY
jgi:hypothetical protein